MHDTVKIAGGTCPPPPSTPVGRARSSLRNIAAALRGRKQQPFAFKTLGQLASIGRRTGVANIMGINFSGFIAWWMWRTIYLMKLPRFERKVRVAMDWTLDLLFTKDLVQCPTARALPGATARPVAAPLPAMRAAS